MPLVSRALEEATAVASSVHVSTPSVIRMSA